MYKGLRVRKKGVTLLLPNRRFRSRTFSLSRRLHSDLGPRCVIGTLEPCNRLKRLQVNRLGISPLFDCLRFTDHASSARGAHMTWERGRFWTVYPGEEKRRG